MEISSFSAVWFLPFVLPICFYVAFTDMREMRITNQAVIALAVVFLVVGLFVLPLPTYGARLLQIFRLFNHAHYCLWAIPTASLTSSRVSRASARA